MIGALIGGGLKAVGSIVGAIGASKTARKAKAGVEQQMNDNQEWYDRRYNEDATQRADAQRIIRLTEERLKKRHEQIAGANAVMGGTDEAVALAKQSGNEMMGNVISQIDASNQARKDAIESQYRAQNANLQSQLNQIEQQRAQAITGAIEGIANAGAGVASALLPAGGGSDEEGAQSKTL